MNRIHYGSIQILIRITDQDPDPYSDHRAGSRSLFGSQSRIQILIRITDQDPDPEIRNLKQNIISVTLLQLFHFYIETVHFFCLFIVKLGPGSESAPCMVKPDPDGDKVMMVSEFPHCCISPKIRFLG